MKKRNLKALLLLLLTAQANAQTLVTDPTPQRIYERAKQAFLDPVEYALMQGTDGIAVKIFHIRNDGTALQTEERITTAGTLVIGKTNLTIVRTKAAPPTPTPTPIPALQLLPISTRMTWGTRIDVPRPTSLTTTTLTLDLTTDYATDGLFPTLFELVVPPKTTGTKYGAIGGTQKILLKVPPNATGFALVSKRDGWRFHGVSQ